MLCKCEDLSVNSGNLCKGWVHSTSVSKPRASVGKWEVEPGEFLEAHRPASRVYIEAGRALFHIRWEMSDS